MSEIDTREAMRASIVTQLRKVPRESQIGGLRHQAAADVIADPPGHQAEIWVEETTKAGL